LIVLEIQLIEKPFPAKTVWAIFLKK